MKKKIDPTKYGLGSRVVLEQIEDNHIAIVKRIKSRIIMKDGRKILEQAQQIKSIDQNTKISLAISGPICRKTVAFLLENGIEVFSI